MTNIEEVQWGGRRSQSWKEVTLKIQSTGETLKIPVMTSTKVQDLRLILAETLGLHASAAHSVEFLAKVGMSMRRLRNSDEIRTQVIIRNLDSFVKPKQKYPHPYVIIGAGHSGLRQAMHYRRHEVDFICIDRFHRIGGNAWVMLANTTSCTQSEGVHYQLCYDPIENTAALKPDYGCWPSCAKILKHFEDVCDEYGVTPHIKLNSDVRDMVINEDADFVKKSYDLFWCSTKDEPDSGKITASNICFYPGSMVHPREAHWPGEDDFQGQLEYAHGNLFDFFQLSGKDVIIIGCGAFANENIRTSIEFGARKIYLVVRNFNIFLPRCPCWLVNESTNAPPGAIVFQMMEPMYKLIGIDVYEMPTVITNKDRSSVILRQNARWGTGDIFFLATYFEKCEVIKGEVKRFKPNGAVLTDGTVLNNVANVMKCLGFSGDFSVDKLMKTTKHVGFWPDGDWRRMVYAEFLAIDAGRFGGTAFGPGGVSISFYMLWYHQHPMDSIKLLCANLLATNTARPDKGKPAYDFPPRIGSTIFMNMSGLVPEIGDFENSENTPFKKASLWYLQYPEKHIKECTEDWNKYCKLITEQGSTKPWPAYPYTPEDMHYFAKLDADLNPSPGQDYVNLGSPKWLYGTPECFYPVRDVLRKRSKSPGSKVKREQVDAWYHETVKSHGLMKCNEATKPHGLTEATTDLLPVGDSWRAYKPGEIHKLSASAWAAVKEKWATKANKASNKASDKVPKKEEEDNEEEEQIGGPGEPGHVDVDEALKENIEEQHDILKEQFNEYVPKYRVFKYPLVDCQLRVICFHNAGSAESTYTALRTPFMDWTKDNGKIEIVALDFPGRDKLNKATKHTKIETLAPELLAVVFDKIADGVPYLVWGHSLGTWVAFEFLMLARKVGLPLPRAAFLNAFPAPHMPAAQRRWHRSRRLSDEEMKEELMSWDSGHFTGPGKAIFDMPGWKDLWLPLMRADFQLFDEYKFKHTGAPKFEFPIHAWHMAGDHFIKKEMIEMWQDWTSATFDHCVMEEMGHLTCFYNAAYMKTFFAKIVENMKTYV